jgi:hypothetical protein
VVQVLVVLAKEQLQENLEQMLLHIMQLVEADLDISGQDMQHLIITTLVVMLYNLLMVVEEAEII